MRLALLGMLGMVAACPPPAKPHTSPSDLGSNNAESEPERRQRMVRELQDDILSSYERDEPSDTDTLLIDPKVGPARIGVGPGDLLYGEEVKLRASSRWPLFVEPGTPTSVRSKRLDIHLSSDRAVSAAWMSDEVSWRIMLCGRTAVIPLRVTALYAHDGDRWVQVFEHLSFGAVPEATPELYGLQMKSAVVDRSLADELSRTLTPLLYRQTSRLAQVVWVDPKHLAEEDLLQPAPTLLLAPDPEGEWHGTDDIGHAQVVDGVLNPDDRRIGTIGPSVEKSTIAYWVGNFVADLADRPGVKGGKVRLRGTFVFEKRADTHTTSIDCTNPKNACKWYVVQGHVSKPMDDINLASIVFGTALLSEKPLQITCDDGRRSDPAATVPAATVPAAAP
jgi:hypothetical protein